MTDLGEEEVVHTVAYNVGLARRAVEIPGARRRLPLELAAGVAASDAAAPMPSTSDAPPTCTGAAVSPGRSAAQTSRAALPAARTGVAGRPPERRYAVTFSRLPSGETA